MVSPVRMFSFKFAGFGWKGNELRYAFVALFVVLAVAVRWWAVPAIVALYVLVSLVRWLVGRKPRNV